jgi:excisionase family DNA binding protein
VDSPATIDATDRLLSPDEVRRRLGGVSLGFVTGLAREGRLNRFYVGRLLRFRESEVTAYIAAVVDGRR